jgi:alpha-N-acetylglucosamine transferase
MANPRIQHNAVIILVAFFAFIIILKMSSIYGTAPAVSSHVPNIIGDTSHYNPSAVGEKPPSKNAFAVFLNANSNTKSKRRGNTIQDEDHYFTGTRMLLYQLLHAPETRTNTSTDFLVLVSKEVPQEARDLLTSEGAIVKEVEQLKFDWIKPGRERWDHVMDKLHVFELVQYEKVLLFDTDIVVTRRIDTIFDDPAAQLSENLGDPTKVLEDEAPQPSTYIMAGNSGPTHNEHPYPAPRGNRLNAGFVILKPSLEMYKHYVTISSIEGRFLSSSPEQNLWNYVHARDRNMPWKQLHGDWTVNTPNYNDYQMGVKTFHEKYWIYNREPELRDVLLRSRWKMEGYFDAFHAKK